MSVYLSKLGANLVITSRKREVLEQTAANIEKLTGGNVLTVPGDVREMNDVSETLSRAIKTFGKVDGLINNAAGNFISPTERLSHRAFKSVIDIVLFGTIHYTLETGKYWIKEKIPGVVLNIITTYAWTGTGYTVPSACGKAGVLALTRSLAVEWGRKYRIRLNAIAPGPFPTEGAWDRLFPSETRDKFDPKKRIPLGRLGHHQEIANLAAYLLSPFSAFINGEVVTIDGGEWLENGGQFNAFKDLTEKDWDMLTQLRKK